MIPVIHAVRIVAMTLSLCAGLLQRGGFVKEKTYCCVLGLTTNQHVVATPDCCASHVEKRFAILGRPGFKGHPLWSNPACALKFLCWGATSDGCCFLCPSGMRGHREERIIGCKHP